LFYAIEKSSPSIITALLRRGADPNVAIFAEGSKGNTPLHFACLFEKYKVAELLLEYGGVPNVMNQYGKVPLQLVPADAVRSTKLFFKKMFEVSNWFIYIFLLYFV
jgi:ankyrin repeat protein